MFAIAPNVPTGRIEITKHRFIYLRIVPTEQKLSFTYITKVLLPWS